MCSAAAGACFAKMVKHNNQIPNQHFKKHWHGGKNAKGSYVRTWFNQPARKTRRANGILLLLFQGFCATTLQQHA